MTDSHDYCAFCGRPQVAVGHLVKGLTGAICDDCLPHVMQSMALWSPRPIPAARVQPPDDTDVDGRVLKYGIQTADGELRGYLLCAEYPDGSLAKVMWKQGPSGNTTTGLLDMVGICISLGLQYGIPLQVFVDKLSHVRFPPAGPSHDMIRLGFAKSITDLGVRMLERRYMKGKR